MYNNGNSSKNVTGASVVDGTLESADFPDDTISGDKIDGGTISDFASTGIDDNATSTAITIDSSENVSVDTGNLVIGTSGKGIDFSATSDGSGTMTSELLDDYEEGTWTPSYNCSTTPPTVSYTARLGYYTKVGRLVHIKGFIQVSSMSSVGTGTVTITGLPFTSQNIPSGSGSIGYCSQFTSTGSPITIIVAQNGTTLTPNKTTSSDARSGTYISCSASDLSTSGGYMYFTAGYYA